MFCVMNHPKPEEWVPYLYGGLKPDTRRQLKSHLRACPDCLHELERWQRSSRRLKAWKLPRTEAPLAWFVPGFKWAVTALLLLGVGFTLGRFAGTDAIASRVRAQIEPQVRQAMQQQVPQLVRDEVARTSPALLQAAGEQTVKALAAYSTANDSRMDDLERLCVGVKRQLDTVAINTEKGFVQLAAYRPPAPNAQ